MAVAVRRDGEAHSGFQGPTADSLGLVCEMHRTMDDMLDELRAELPAGDYDVRVSAYINMVEEDPAGLAEILKNHLARSEEAPSK